MDNSLEKDFLRPFEIAEGVSRRDLLKRAAGAGLALAGVGGLVGCAHVDRTEYDYDTIIGRYARNPIQINSIDDFALSGEELGEMRFSKGAEKARIPYFTENPLKGRGNDYPLQERKRDTPICEEWILTENVGQNWNPWYTIIMFTKKFKSEEDFLNMKEKIKNMDSREIENLENILHYGFKSRVKVSFNIFSKYPFITEFTSGGFEFSGRGPEHRTRTILYQTKRNLEFVRGNFNYFSD